jgi:glycosyltransferase involved in cell wall biosynthesis
MKILQIVHGFPPESIGGTERYTEAVAWGLARKGHASAVLSGTEEVRPSPTITTADCNGLPVSTYIGSTVNPVHWSPPYRPEAERVILGYLKDVRPDVVHVQHWPRLTINLVAICRSLGIPTVITLHDLWATCPLGYRLRPDRRLCPDPFPAAPCVTCVARRDGETDGEIAMALADRERLVAEELRQADCVLVPSEALKGFLRTLLSGDGVVDMEVLPHAAISELPPRPGSSVNPLPAPLRVGYWGSLAWWKGPHLLLEALHHLPNPKRVEAHLFGPTIEPSYRDQLSRLAEGLAVVFHGAFHPTDLSRAAFHVAAFPSLCFESYSLVLDEALRLGVPVIVPDRGAPAERVGSAGLIFRVGEARDLARQIQRVLEEPGLLKRLQHGRPAAPLVGLEDHVARLEAIYRRVIAIHQAGRNGGRREW